MTRRPKNKKQSKKASKNKKYSELGSFIADSEGTADGNYTQISTESAEYSYSDYSS